MGFRNKYSSAPYKPPPTVFANTGLTGSWQKMPRRKLTRSGKIKAAKARRHSVTGTITGGSAGGVAVPNFNLNAARQAFYDAYGNITSTYRNALPPPRQGSRSRASSMSVGSDSDNYSGSILPEMYGTARHGKKRVMFPTKRRASKAQRIVSTITPARSVTYQFNGVMESQQYVGQAAASTGAPTPFSSAEFAHGSNTSVPLALSGIYGNIAQDKADPGSNAWCFQTLFHGSCIDQLQRMCQANSDAPTLVEAANLTKNNLFWISSYSVVHTLHNPTTSPVYVYRYEIVPRQNLKNVTDLMYCMQHRTGQGDNVVTPYNTSAVIASDRSWVTPDVNPNEFPLFKARFKIMRKRKFTIQPGATIYVPFAGKMNRKINMHEYNQKRIQVKPENFSDTAGLTEWGTDATFLCKGLTKILAYQAFGIPAVQGTTGSTSVGSNVSNRVTTTPAQLIIRATVRYRVHGALDTARRYATFKLDDNLETATSAISGQPGNSTHAITVTNQI